MIHSTRSMPSGNFADPQRPFRFPADYYCAPLSDVTPIFPRWVPFGCGGVSAVILLLLFAAGAVISGPRLAEFMDLFLGTSLGELRSMYAPDVSAAEKQRFDDEVERMREGLRTGQVTVKAMQPFMRAMQSAIADKRVTAEEVDRLANAAHEAQKKPAKPPQQPRRSVSVRPH